ncbi:MAG TPA: cyclic nucleotide-binding domain-containing protein [Ilumatobacteraceae bacterium]|nr:cyclic nucleotide-binding domain-containing protein [Ilumatobacteraceae bacterium]
MSDLLTHCADLPRRRIDAGSTIIEQGDIGGTVFILVEGSVSIERDDTVLALLDTPGALLGEMSTVLGRPASASVRAITDATLLEAHDGAAFLREHPEVLLEVARTLAIRLDNLTGHLVDVKRQYGNEGGHLGMLDDVLSTLMHHQGRQVSPGSARLPDPDY